MNSIAGKIAAILLLMPMVGGGSMLLAQSIVLRSEATIDTAQVRLGQIARVSSPVAGEAEQVAAMEIAAAPAVGSRVTIALANVRDRLGELGLNRAVWTIHGSAGCQVTRVEGAARQIEKMQERSQRMRAGLAGPIIAVEERDIPDSLAGCIRDLLDKQLCPNGGTLRVEFSPADRSVLALQRPQFRFELAVRRVTDRFVDLTADIHAAEAPAEGRPRGQADTLVKSADLRVRVELSAPVVVAKANINRGQVLTSDDVHVAVRPVGLTSGAIRELSAAVGQQAKRMIRSEEVVVPDDLTPLALVHRNKLVTVWIRNGSMLIKTVGRAMQDGVYGERIMVRNESSRQPFYAIVSGPDTVELDPTPVVETRRPTPESSPRPPQPQTSVALSRVETNEGSR